LRMLALAAAGIFIAVIAGWFVYTALFSGAARAPIAPAAQFRNPRIIVLPFESNTEAGRSLGVGLADAITGKLGNLKQIEVLSASTGRSAAGMPPSQLAAELNVAAVLRGRLETSNGVTSVTAELVDADDGTVL